MTTIQKLKDDVGKLNKKLASNNTKAAKANKVLSDENTNLKETVKELRDQLASAHNKITELEAAEHDNANDDERRAAIAEVSNG